LISIKSFRLAGIKANQRARGNQVRAGAVHNDADADCDAGQEDAYSMEADLVSSARVCNISREESEGEAMKWVSRN
jgi:hypothetical protein